MEVRETLRAVLKVEADKIQQPIGTAARQIEVGLTITNTGNATGTDVELVVMPSGIAVHKPRTYRIQRRTSRPFLLEPRTPLNCRLR